MSVVVTSLRHGVFVNTECLWLRGWQWETELIITRLAEYQYGTTIRIRTHVRVVALG